MLRDDVMRLLINGVWVELEAAERDIRISGRMVRRELRRQKRAAFSTEADYRRYLELTRQTEADILYRIRLDLLATRIREQVSVRAVTPEGQTRVIRRFVRRFKRKWRARTVCGQGYAVDLCSRTILITPPSPPSPPPPAASPPPPPVTQFSSGEAVAAR